MSDTVKNSYEDFAQRFDTLAEEAKTYGIASLIVLHDDNPIAVETTTNVRWSGGIPLCLGLAEVAKARLTERFLSSETDV